MLAYADYQENEIKATTHKLNQTKWQRSMTTALLPLCKVEEVVHSIGHTLKNGRADKKNIMR
jgi:hypothetical protein